MSVRSRAPEITPEQAKQIVERMRGSTHWECCWKEYRHHECAVGRVAELEAALESDRIEFLRKWMNAPNPMLGGAIPIEMMLEGNGRRVAQFIQSALQPPSGEK